MEEITIRPYTREDRAAVREIAWKTAFLGEAAGAFFEGKDILSSFLTEYFTDYEAESCFVAEAKGRVIGYILGAKDSRRMARIFQDRILLRLIIRLLKSGALIRKINLIFLFRCLVSFLRGEFLAPDFFRDYPAILHINIEEEFRSLRLGSRLISAYLAYLAREGVRGVSLATMSPKAAGFFNKQGFCLLYRGRRSYFNYILHKEVPLYLYGKRI